MLTLQQIFDQGVAQVVLQGCLAQVDAGGGCSYRTSEGNKCIVGGFIADPDYSPAFDDTRAYEDTSVAYLINHSAEFRKALMNAGIDWANPKVVDLLKEMQDAHDQSTSRSSDQQMVEFGDRMAAMRTRMFGNTLSKESA
jgi:hypothetical protein